MGQYMFFILNELIGYFVMLAVWLDPLGFTGRWWLAELAGWWPPFWRDPFVFPRYPSIWSPEL